MIMRRPEIWGTMGGEVLDDVRSSDVIGIVAGMQEQEQQQQHTQGIESSRSASSGGNGGWGSRAELLLVSAVKKHGVPNWNLVALELKARAMLLDIPPSYFSDEACQYRYNALKGKFARDGGGGSREDDLNGVSWFEELRKLRVSHLKEELQCYDSSIVQLQSRINKLKEERAQCPSLQAVAFQQYDSSYGADTNPKLFKHADSKITAESLRSKESILEQPQTPVSKSPEQPDPGVHIGRQNSFKETGVGGTEFGKDDGVLAIAIQAANQGAADATEKGRASSELPRSGEDTYEVHKDEVADKRGESEEALQTLGIETVQQRLSQEEVDDCLSSEQETFQQKPLAQESVNEKTVEQASSEGRGAVDPDQGTAGGGFSCSLQALEGENASGEDLINPGNETSNDGDGKFEHTGDRSGGGDEQFSETGDSRGDTVYFTSPSQGVPAEVPQNLPCEASAETPLVTCDWPPGSHEADSSHVRGGDQIESSMMERPLSRLSLAYGKAEKAKKEKLKEAAELVVIPRPEIPAIAGNEPTQSSVAPEVSEKPKAIAGNEPTQSQVTPEVSEIPKAELIDTGSTDKLLEHSEGSGAIPLDTAPSDEVHLPARQQQDAADISAKGFEDGTDERTPIKDCNPPSVVDIPPGDSGLGRSEGAEPMSLVVDLVPVAGTLTEAPGQDRDESLISSSGHSTSGKQGGDKEGVPSAQMLIEVKSENELLEVEAPNEATSEICVINPSNAAADVKVEQVSPVADDVRVQGETANMWRDEEIKDIEHDQELKEAEADKICGGEEIGTRDRDSGATRSTGDDALEIKGCGSNSEEIKDSAETGEGRPMCPENTDSQVDKSEVGSSMDSVEGMSPSSRKSRREPKVSGKFLPLLECLRVICAHKFAPLFRQKQEYQESVEYDRLVRRHVDLSMVRARLEDGAYSGSVEFFRDLLLIFTNALVYSNSESQEYAGAKVLRRCALAEMDKILQTEALLKQNGPATRKREGKKLAEVYKPRVSAPGPEAMKRGKGSSNETVVAPDLHVGSRNSLGAFDDTTLQGGKASNSSGQERDVDGAAEDAKKLAVARLESDETPRKELRKPESLYESNRNGNSRKKVKVENIIQKSGSLGQVTVDNRASGGRLKVEKTPSNTKDVMCTDGEKKGPLNFPASVAVPPRLPTGNRHQQTQPPLKQTSTSRVSRYSKRAGDSTTSNPKKRVRK